MIKNINKIRLSVLAAVLTIGLSVPVVFAQTEAQVRTVTSGMKMKLKGIVVSKDADKLVVRDMTGVDTNVVLTPATSIKTKGGFFRTGNVIPTSGIVRGLNLEAEGIGDSSGNLIANKVRFGKDDFMVAQSIESRVAPAEERISQSEQNAQRMSGQIDELVAVSNAARGGAKAAQETADAAVAGVNATNERISAMDDYVVQSTSTVNFRVGSSVLSPESKTNLDQVAQTALSLKGYVIEVTGFTDASGSVRANKELSKRRAQAVLDYLVETHNIPLRRISTSYGFGEMQAVAENTTRDGRAQNRRVEVKLLVSRGLNQNVEVRAPQATPPADNPNPTNNK